MPPVSAVKAAISGQPRSTNKRSRPRAWRAMMSATFVVGVQRSDRNPGVQTLRVCELHAYHEKDLHIWQSWKGHDVNLPHVGHVAEIRLNERNSACQISCSFNLKHTYYHYLAIKYIYDPSLVHLCWEISPVLKRQPSHRLLSTLNAYR